MCPKLGILMMPAYNYEALDTNGTTKRGVIAADSKRDANHKLRTNSLFPTNIVLGKEKKKSSGIGIDFLKQKSISSKDLTLITRQMATLFSAGTPVEEALYALATQSEKSSIRDVMIRLRVEVSEGKRLSDAMSSDQTSFPALYRSMIRAGEASGDLGGIMEKIADYGEKTEKIRNTISTAMVYPIVLSVVAAAVLVILMTFVVPKVITQFENIGADLPGLTLFVMALSEFLVGYGLLLAGVIVGFTAFYVSALKHKLFRKRVHATYLKIPVIGRLVLSVSSARFARTLGTLIEGGSPVLESITAAKETVTNEVIRDAIDKIYLRVLEGQSLSLAMKQAGVFSSLLVYMCSLGEKSGRLSFMLLKIADYLESEFESFTNKALSLLEPMIIIIMGVMVGIIVLSIMLPIMRLNSLVLM